MRSNNLNIAEAVSAPAHSCASNHAPTLVGRCDDRLISRRDGLTTMATHPRAIAFYAVPDLEPPVREKGPTSQGWATTQNNLHKLHALLPHAWVRWDNETGHVTDTPDNVETMVACAARAGVDMIITASAVDGYDNCWAAGKDTANKSLLDFANDPTYLVFAHEMACKYPNVRFVETANEADITAFNTDADNVAHFKIYLDAVRRAMGQRWSQVLGPSVASTGSSIWRFWVDTMEHASVSYHNYSGWRGLKEVPGRQVYVTEYGLSLPDCTKGVGGQDMNPGAVLGDLYAIEQRQLLGGSHPKIVLLPVVR